MKINNPVITILYLSYKAILSLIFAFWENSSKVKNKFNTNKNFSIHTYKKSQPTSRSNYGLFHPMHNKQHKHTKKNNQQPYMFHHQNTPINFIRLTFQQLLNNLRSKLWGVARTRHTALYTRLAYNGYLDLEVIFCKWVRRSILVYFLIL